MWNEMSISFLLHELHQAHGKWNFYKCVEKNISFVSYLYVSSVVFAVHIIPTEFDECLSQAAIKKYSTKNEHISKAKTSFIFTKKI